jgi:diguanylate cyclase (GGDEF)-like protein
MIRESMIEMVAVCDLTGALTMMNRAMAAAVGGPGASGSPAAPAWKHRRLDGRAYAAANLPLRRALRGEVVTDEEMTVTWPDNRRQSVVVNATTVFDEDGRTLGAVVMMRDITQQRDAEATVAFQSLHDSLTGLPGRLLLVERVQRALNRGARHGWSTALFAVKIDGFEAINAQFGHDAGDQVTKEVGNRLQACVRASDAVSRESGNVARLGGDDFFLLCERIGGVRGATSMAVRIMSRFERPIATDREAIRISVHVGIRVVRGAKHNPNVVIREATSALGLARETGVGRTAFFAEEMAPAETARFDDEHALRNALERGELRVAFQPKISLATDRVVGVEALLRWDHPQRGAIPPASFIPLAEATGLIVPIGAWVLRQACQQGVRWRELNGAVSAPIVSVNLSRRVSSTPACSRRF